MWNPLNVAEGRLQLLDEERDGEHIEAIERSLDRMELLIDDMLTLARQDGDIRTRSVTVGAIAESAWEQVATADASLTDETSDLTVKADPDRLQHLFENAFRNSGEHGGEDVVVTVAVLPDRDRFAITDDG